MKKFVICMLVLALLLAGCSMVRDGVSAEPATQPTTTEPAATEQTTQPVTEPATEPTTHNHTHEEPNPENIAPDFTVYDVTGKAVKLSDFRGKPVVLNFWASWCGPCQSEMPHFQKLYEEVGDQVQFVMVNLADAWGDTKASAENLLKKQGYTFPVYYDTQGVLTNLYGISGVPATLFLDEQGAVVAAWSGALTEQYLRQGISVIIE